jgi:hypothetical protein
VAQIQATFVTYRQSFGIKVELVASVHHFLNVVLPVSLYHTHSIVLGRPVRMPWITSSVLYEPIITSQIVNVVYDNSVAGEIVIPLDTVPHLDEEILLVGKWSSDGVNLW